MSKVWNSGSSGKAQPSQIVTVRPQDISNSSASEVHLLGIFVCKEIEVLLLFCFVGNHGVELKEELENAKQLHTGKSKEPE